MEEYKESVVKCKAALMKYAFGDKSYCGNYREIELLSIPCKMDSKIPSERMQKTPSNNINEEQDKFKTRRNCINQEVNMRKITEKLLAKERKGYAAFMDLEMAYSNRIVSKAI